MKREHKGNQTDYRPYRVENFEVPKLPFYYTLDKAHVLVKHLSAPIICGRIAEYARIQSLVTSYSEEEVATIKCMSKDGVEIHVNLWKVNDNYSHPEKEPCHEDPKKPSIMNTYETCMERGCNKCNSDEWSLVVEARRYTGDPIQANKLKRKLFRVILGQKDELRSTKIISESKKKAKLLRMQFRANGKVPTKSDTLHLCSQRLKSVHSLLISASKYDLENGAAMLYNLTDPLHTHTYVASSVSCMIWAAFDPCINSRLRITDILIHYIKNPDLDASMHYWALRIMSNVFMCITSKKLKLSRKDMDKWSPIAPMLCRAMCSYETDTHVASAAMQCLKHLICTEDNVEDDDNKTQRTTIRKWLQSEEMYPNAKDLIGQMILYGRDCYQSMFEEGIEIYKLLSFHTRIG
ncbi:predicted protein [Chaetoceros tenuissimus]|uniref:Uncharacterized protein n=1 Tax=Chaetoceros tenuissimus TaxID=426638 RepID=A0AAD3H0V4_9STRA|nr:predicted protein [Chaetoceros tenuissimus]